MMTMEPPAVGAHHRLLPVLYCYSGARWSSYPGRQFELMRALSAHTHVLFLNAPEIKGHVAEFRIPRAEAVAPNLTVIHNAFTFKSCRSGKHLGPGAAIPDSMVFHKLLRSLGVEEYIFWLSSPRLSLLWGIRSTHLVYDCIDPAPESDAHHEMHRKETWLARRSAVVFCTAGEVAGEIAAGESPLLSAAQCCWEARFSRCGHASCSLRASQRSAADRGIHRDR